VTTHSKPAEADFLAAHLSVQKCNLCGGTQYHKRFYKAPYTRLECDNCGLVWSQEQPDFKGLTSIYGAEYFNGATYLNYAQDQPVIELNARKRLQALQRYIERPGTVIEVGCATGFFLDVCRSAGWTTKGVELSDYASQYAREQLKLDVITGTLADAHYPPDSAQLVALWDVIEHVPDPMGTLKTAATLVEPGGLLVLSTGDIDSLISRLLGPSWRLITYDHLFYFSARTMRKYLESVGLEVIKVSYPGRIVSPTLVAHMALNHYLKVPVLRKPLLKIAGLLPDISLNFYDVMTVYARKPVAAGT
jgi:2-polyprenyl-3-methyl-5-hydroxy-6-metoxy-1,4-benzoquinol methylase